LIIEMICSSENLERLIIHLQNSGTDSTQKWRSFEVSGQPGGNMGLRSTPIEYAMKMALQKQAA